MGKVYLVGAGPGDAGLITQKGLEQLKSCDVVVYDRLVSEELLEEVRLDCKKIYVGKEAGKHYKKQEEINEILVKCAKTYQRVVRLKGGDPFVFGRGGEEIEALCKEHIPYEIIPGVTSAIAVPECAGIPVTHRGIARSFHVITGHTKNSIGSPAYDYETLGKLEGTLVFLMGISNLGEIVQQLIRAGKSADTPTAVISEGTTLMQKTIRATLGTIEEKVKVNRLQSPAVIVIGETSAYEYLYPALERKRVGIIATKPLRKKLESGLEELGMQPVSLCKMEVIPTKQMQELDRELKRLNHYQWILFTSQNAISLFFQEMKSLQIDIRILGKLKFAVLGSGTAKKLSEYGIRADFIPSAYTISVCAKEFAQVVKEGEKVLIPRAVQGSKELTKYLQQKQIDFFELAIYDVIGKMSKQIKDLEQLDFLVFVSASGVTAFFEEVKERKLTLPAKIKTACIGKITEKRLIEQYGKADIVATVNDVEGLLNGIKQYMMSEHGSKKDRIAEVKQYGTHEKITGK